MGGTTGRILTTHVGSLPRSPVVSDLLLKREFDNPYDPGFFERTMRDANDDIVRW